MIQRGRAVDSEPTHHGKASAIHNREILILPGLPNLPRGLQIGEAYLFNNGNPISETVPKAICSIKLKAISNQGPCFHKHMIRCDQRFVRLEDVSGASVVRVGRIHRRIPDRCIDEDTHWSISVFSRETP